MISLAIRVIAGVGVSITATSETFGGVGDIVGILTICFVLGGVFIVLVATVILFLSSEGDSLIGCSSGDIFWISVSSAEGIGVIIPQTMIIKLKKIPKRSFRKMLII
ncbi:MAG: hypothetical protein AAB682_00050 [Patescibacteria group bacterium]